MGHSINIDCGQCGYKEGFILGIGMSYTASAVFYDDDPMLVSLVKDPAIVKKALKLIHGGGCPGTI